MIDSGLTRCVFAVKLAEGSYVGNGYHGRSVTDRGARIFGSMNALKNHLSQAKHRDGYVVECYQLNLLATLSPEELPGKPVRR